MSVRLEFKDLLSLKISVTDRKFTGRKSLSRALTLFACHSYCLYEYVILAEVVESPAFVSRLLLPL